MEEQDRAAPQPPATEADPVVLQQQYQRPKTSFLQQNATATMDTDDHLNQGW